MQKIIVGLGNPEEKHKYNRHNVGYMVLDVLNNKSWQKSKSGLLLYSWFRPDIELVKPLAYMNDSGVAVKYAVNKHKVKGDNLYIIHDDLDLPLGAWKVQYAKGPKDNGGINSIEQVLGTKDFWRIRVGIDNRNPEKRVLGEEYVLQDFSEEEKTKLNLVIGEICKKLATL
jgi:peptidyl-tRNA hydrolase, PTH1 family